MYFWVEQLSPLYPCCSQLGPGGQLARLLPNFGCNVGYWSSCGAVIRVLAWPQRSQLSLALTGCVIWKRAMFGSPVGILHVADCHYGGEGYSEALVPSFT